MSLHFIAVALQHMLNLNAPVKSLAVAEPVWKVSFVHHVIRNDHIVYVQYFAGMCKKTNCIE